MTTIKKPTIQTMVVLFWLCKKRSKNGKPAIYARIIFNRKRVEIVTRQHIAVKFWDKKVQCVKETTPNAESINRQLLLIKADLQKHYDRLVALEKPITAEILKNNFLGVGEKDRTMQELFDSYYSRFKEKVSIGRKAVNTLKSIYTTHEKVKAFLKFKFRVTDITLGEIKKSFAPDLEHFLLTQHRLSNNSAMKYIRILKRMMKYATDQDWLANNPLNGFKCSYIEPHRERLTWDEVMMLYKKEFQIDRLSEVRDVFIFCCFTGYAYQDVLNLTQDNIVKGIDGGDWVVKHREKTNNAERVPLLPIPLEIIDRYKNHRYVIETKKLLPVNTNQLFNGYLKEIASVCGIHKYLTTHTARHTFATTITLEHDVPIETVSQMLGHKSIRTTQIYAKVTQRKISNNMLELRSKIHGSICEVKKQNS
ncbi:MAG: site-specific integrase [Bacteroidetes bacterium]|nr:site-specific integrase [Bacteroidota bacterium]